MRAMRVFVTGVTGCVGSYVLRDLLSRPGIEVVALLRDGARCPADLRDHPRLRLIVGDLRDLARVMPALQGIDAAVLIATAWGGPDTMTVTCDANAALARALAAAGCQRLFYFSTASVLDRQGRLLDVARSHGTEYIQAKHALVEAMESLPGPMQVTGLFPTLVLGGEDGPEGAPRSHLARLLPQVLRHLWLIRFLDAEARLHMIHAADIAGVVGHLVATPAAAMVAGKRLVLGNPAWTAGQLVDEGCAHFGRRRRPLLTLRPAMAEPLIRLFRIELSVWDRHCMENPDQSYDAPVNPASFGLPVAMPDFSAGLSMIGLPRRD